ncbi:MAG: FMN-binding negative transcriptional regulator [Halocynthiibacter sp.]
MHPNKIFRNATGSQNMEFARDRGFGTLMVADGDDIHTAHLPFVMDHDTGEDDYRLGMHLVRSNPIARAVKGPRKAVITILGPDGYISPDWYGDTPNLVPTWNYVAVTLTGTLTPSPDAALRSLLERTSHEFERRLDKPEWKINKVSDDAFAKMARQIVPYTFNVDSIDGTWKLGQNKPEDARLGAAGALRESNVGSGLTQLSHLMEKPPT